MGTSAWRGAIALACSLPYGDNPIWEYEVVEEPKRRVTLSGERSDDTVQQRTQSGSDVEETSSGRKAPR